MRLIELRSDIDQEFVRFLKEEARLVEEKYGHLTEKEINQLNEEQLNEWIPQVLMAFGAGITAYDNWKKYKPQFDAAGGGRAGWDAIKKPLTNDVMGDLAVLGTLGGAGKVASIGINALKNAWKAKKAAKIIAGQQKGIKTIGQDVPPVRTPLTTAKSAATAGASTVAGSAAATQTDWDKWSEPSGAY